jgi:hypothetical protein
MRPAEELLYDSEASFRLVDDAIREFGLSSADLEREANVAVRGRRPAADDSTSEADRRRVVASLREELGRVVHQLQRQDMTADELQHIESQLSDMNSRINEALKVFAAAACLADDEQHADDEIFHVPGGRTSA